MLLWIALIGLGTLFVLWLLINYKASRSDGTLIKKVHKYRTMMFYIMPRRNDSIVYYDTYALADNMLDYLGKARSLFHCDVTHIAVAAASLGFIQTPKMNRFVMGRRLYQRKGRWITFSMKRIKKDADAKLTAIKLEMDDAESFRGLCERMGADIEIQRSSTKTYHDKEYDLLTAIPRPVLNCGVRLFYWLDYHNILPASFIKSDPLYTGMVIANLGSVKMAPGFHHMYEWGTCPLFLMVGQLEERALVVDGEIKIRRVLPLRWTYDERIDDGLSSRRGIVCANRVIEDPAKYLGCLAADGSDTFPIGQVKIPEEELRI